jgi:hypothetical protein
MVENTKPLLFKSLEELHAPVEFSDNDIHGELPLQASIAAELVRWAERILKMKWITAEQFYADPKRTCPKCGGDDLITD